MSRFRYALILAALLAAVVPAEAQQPADSSSAAPLPASPDTSVVEIQLADGSRFTGTVVRETDTELVLRTTGGAVVHVEKAQIRQRRALAGRVEGGRFVREDPNRSRLFFAPTARPVGGGEGYVAVYEVFFPFVAYGATGAVSLAGGITLFPTTELQLVYAAPKVTLVQTESAAFAVGGVVTVPFGSGTEGNLAGIGFGLGTFGSVRKAVTVGAGYGFVRTEREVFDPTTSDVRGEAEWNGQPLLMLGGEVQVSNSVKLISENYLFTYEDGGTYDPLTGTFVDTETEVVFLVSGGIRFFGENLAADLALFTSPDFIREGVPFIPWIGFAYNF